MSQRDQIDIELLRKTIADSGDGVFTAADEAKLDGIETGATADQAWGDIGGTLSSQTDLQSALDAKQADLDVVSQAEAEAGTATTERIWTAERVAQAIAALAAGGGGGGGSGAWEVIEVIDASADSSVDFSSIPATYSALRLVFDGIISGTAGDNVDVQINGDTGSNYTRSILYNNNASSAAGFKASGDSGGVKVAFGDISTTGEILIPGYANTARKKNLTTTFSYTRTSGGTEHHDVRAQAGIWNSTAAINQVELIPVSGQTMTGKFILLGLNETPSTVDRTWTAVTFDGNWEDYPGFQGVEYRMGSDGDSVEFRGLARCPSSSSEAAGNPVFNLPADFRPATQRLFVLTGYGIGGTTESGIPVGTRVDIKTDGDVAVSDAVDSAPASYLSFDGMKMYGLSA